MKNCNVELLKYGLNKLKNMPEEYLDAMDPYQRSSNKISEYPFKYSTLSFNLFHKFLIYKILNNKQKK